MDHITHPQTPSRFPKLSFKSILILLGGFVVLQLIILYIVNRFDVNINESSGISTERELWQKSDYQPLSLLSGTSHQDDMRIYAAQLKQGSMDVRTGLYDTTWSTYPERWNMIMKAGYLYRKQDYENVEKVLSQVAVKDTRIISLVLGLRSYSFCKQRMRIECQTLANNSIILDPLAALGYYTKGASSRALSQYNDAKQALVEYTARSGTITNELISQLGIVYFYTRERDLSKQYLNMITGDPKLGNEATIFLGRSYFDNKDYDTAKLIFERALEKNSTGSYVPYLRLARTQQKLGNRNKAMQYYQDAYELFPNAIELITDMMLLASKQNDTKLVNDLKNAVTMSVGNSLYSYEIAGRKYREIGENALSEKFLRQGIDLLSGITQTISSANQKKSIYTQLHHTLVQYVFDNYSYSELTQPYYNELNDYNINESQILFTKKLQNIIHQTHNPIQTSEGFTGRIISNQDMKFAQARYYILKEDYRKATVSINAIPAGQGDDIKIQRLWAAYRIQQGDLQKAYTYINTIRGAGFLAKIPNGEPESEFRLWQQAFRPFNPWINRLVPYLAQDKLIE